MPITQSAAKALRQAEKRKIVNLRVKRAFKAVVKEFRAQAAQKNFAQAKSLLPAVYQKADKAAKTGVIKKNTARRYKSRLAQLLTRPPKSASPKS